MSNNYQALNILPSSHQHLNINSCFEELIDCFIKQSKLTTLGVLPFGAIARDIDNNCLNKCIKFFDKSPYGSAIDSALICEHSADTFLIATYLYHVELTNFLLDKKVSPCKIYTIDKLKSTIVQNQAVEYIEKLKSSKNISPNHNVVFIINEYDGELSRKLLNTHFPFAVISILDLEKDIHRLHDDIKTQPINFLHKLKDVDQFICLTPAMDYPEVLRTIETLTNGNETIVFPFCSQKEIEQHIPKPIKPAFFYSFPHAGHGRLYPVLQKIADHVKIKQSPLVFPCSNPYYLATNKNESISKKKQDMDLAVSAQLNQLIPNTFALTHDVFSFKPLINNKNINSVLLMRELKDLITSMVLRFAPKNFEEFCLQAFDGFFHTQTNVHEVMWPSIEELCDLYENALQCPHIFCLKFEDIHLHPLKTYQNLIEFLGWESIDETILTSFFKYGEFAHQTAGKLTRGNVGDKTIGSCRKGIIGDWKNHWSPKLLDTFNQRIAKKNNFTY